MGNKRSMFDTHYAACYKYTNYNGHCNAKLLMQLKSFRLIIFRRRFIGLKIFKCTCFSWIISSVNTLH